MSHLLRRLSLALLLSLSPVAVQALSVGEPAPDWAAASWARGDAVDAPQPGTVYVVEFWATWCGPCRTSIPHLTTLQHTYRDQHVVVIGVTDEPDATVQPFLARMGDQMDYTIMLDDRRQTYEAYMKATGQSGIPHAFLVDHTGLLVWHGHPMSGLDAALEQAVAAAESARASQGPASGLAASVAALKARRAAYRDALDRGDRAAVASYATFVLAEYPDHPAVLNDVSWEMLTAETLTDMDPGVALAVARAAWSACGEADFAVADTLALAHFRAGDVAQAVALQERAVALSPDERRTWCEERLEGYRNPPPPAPEPEPTPAPAEPVAPKPESTDA